MTDSKTQNTAAARQRRGAIIAGDRGFNHAARAVSIRVRHRVSAARAALAAGRHLDTVEIGLIESLLDAVADGPAEDIFPSSTNADDLRHLDTVGDPKTVESRIPGLVGYWPATRHGAPRACVTDGAGSVLAAAPPTYPRATLVVHDGREWVVWSRGAWVDRVPLGDRGAWLYRDELPWSPRRSYAVDGRGRLIMVQQRAFLRDGTPVLIDWPDAVVPSAHVAGYTHHTACMSSPTETLPP